jgi:nucleolin
MNAKLFIRNLSWSVTEDNLYDLFGQVGNVLSVKIPTRREDGKPRGFAFVEMGSLEEGQRAIDTLNGRFLHDRELVVAQQDENRPGASGASGIGPRGNNRSQNKSNKLFIRSLSYAVTEEDLQQLFEQAGTVLTVKIPTDRDTGASKGFGFVEMASIDEAETAIETLNQSDLKNKAIIIDYQDLNRSNTHLKPRSNRDSYGRSQNNHYERPDYSTRW